MADVTVKLKMGGIQTLLRSREVRDEIARRAKRGADAAGEGFEYVVRPHRYTSRAYVQTNSAVGEQREADDKVLIRAMDAMR